jgi:hypothetical protein
MGYNENVGHTQSCGTIFGGEQAPQNATVLAGKTQKFGKFALLHEKMHIEPPNFPVGDDSILPGWAV